MQSRRPVHHAVIVTMSIAAVLTAAVGMAGTSTATPTRRARSAAAKLGRWTTLRTASGIASGTPTIWQDGKHRADVLWLRKVATSKFTYEVSPISAKGKPGGVIDAFKNGHWGSLSNEPTLVGQSGKPLVVFSGIKGSSGKYSLGCVVGALGPSAPWSLQPWSLSNDCVNPVGPATTNSSSTVAAAWGGSHAVEYRIGTSPSIPATGPDKSIALAASGDPYKIGLAYSHSGDLNVAWAQSFSSPASHDGYYVKDVTAGGPAVKAPGSNTDSINRLGQFANLAIAARLGHSGVYVAYCTGSSKCKLKLWHVGAKKAMSLPGSPSPGMVSIAGGPGGRIWVAWFDESTLKVYVTRTNSAVTKLGAVHSYKTPCVEHGLLGLSSGTSGRLDVAMQCLAKSLKAAEYFTQVEVGLHVSAKPHSVTNTKAHKVTMKVTDVGDAVKGAKVKFDGHSATTNGKGKVSFTLKKHTKPGKYRATASKSEYHSAHATVKVKA